MDSSGKLLTPAEIAIANTEGDQLYSSNKYLIVWEDYQVVWGDEDYPEGYKDIYGARVSPEGAVIDTFPACAQPGAQIEPAIARRPGNQLLIVFWVLANEKLTLKTYDISGRCMKQFTIYPLNHLTNSPGMALTTRAKISPPVSTSAGWKAIILPLPRRLQN